MAKTFTPDDRRRLAAKVAVHPGSLYQALTGRGGLNARECVRIELASDHELRRWHLRPTDWHLIWPELVGSEGAPEVPTKEAA